MSKAKKFKDWHKDRCGHPLGVNLGMKAVNELEQENAELREALNTLVYKDSWGNYFTGLHGDSDVTEIVKELLNK